MVLLHNIQTGPSLQSSNNVQGHPIRRQFFSLATFQCSVKIVLLLSFKDFWVNFSKGFYVCYRSGFWISTGNIRWTKNISPSLFFLNVLLQGFPIPPWSGGDTHRSSPGKLERVSYPYTQQLDRFLCQAYDGATVERYFYQVPILRQNTTTAEV